MNQTQATIGRLLLAIAAALAQVGALASDVTVIGHAGLAPSSAATVQDAGPTLPDAAAPAAVAPRYGQQWPNGESAEPQAEPCPPALRTVDFGCPCESTWYGRFDYYHFGSQSLDSSTCDEDGILYTVGYSRRIGPELFRIEFFSGNADYFQRGANISNADSTTINLGIRGEAEYHWPLASIGAPPVEFFVGLGTRAWVRDVKDGTTFNGADLLGFQDTWWSVYPYIGLEKKWIYENGWETFLSGRIGCTAFTYEHASGVNLPATIPRLDITGQLEAGIRRRSLSVAAYFDALTWERSNNVWSDGVPYYYPASQLVTIGIKLGLTY